MWAKQAGGTRSDDGYALALCPSGEIMVSGSIFFSANFDGAVYSTVEGSVDAFVAQLLPQVPTPSVFLRIIRPGNQLHIDGTMGKTVTIQATGVVNPPVTWSSQTNFVLTGEPVTWTDKQADTLKQRFYRAVIQP